MFTRAMPVEHSPDADRSREPRFKCTRENRGMTAQRKADAADVTVVDEIEGLQKIHAPHDVPRVLAHDRPLRVPLIEWPRIQELGAGLDALAIREEINAQSHVTVPRQIEAVGTTAFAGVRDLRCGPPRKPNRRILSRTLRGAVN